MKVNCIVCNEKTEDAYYCKKNEITVSYCEDHKCECLSHVE